MHRRHFVALLSFTLSSLALAQAAPDAAQPVRYEATQDGVRTELALQLDGTRFNGALAENGLQLQIRGQLQGRLLRGQLVEPQSGRVLLPVTGERTGDTLQLSFQMPGQAARQLTMRRVSSPASAMAAGAVASAGVAPAGTAIDPRLVGRWTRQSTTSSGGGAGGFASFTTERTLRLQADGQLEQRVRSAGGGAQWSTSSAERVEFYGRWTAQGGTLWVQLNGQSAYQQAASYRFVDQRLITEDARGRQIWQR